MRSSGNTFSQALHALLVLAVIGLATFVAYGLLPIWGVIAASIFCFFALIYLFVAAKRIKLKWYEVRFRQFAVFAVTALMSYHATPTYFVAYVRHSTDVTPFSAALI